MGAEPCFWRQLLISMSVTFPNARNRGVPLSFIVTCLTLLASVQSCEPRRARQATPQGPKHREHLSPETFLPGKTKLGKKGGREKEGAEREKEAVHLHLGEPCERWGLLTFQVPVENSLFQFL